MPIMVLIMYSFINPDLFQNRMLEKMRYVFSLLNHNIWLCAQSLVIHLI